MKLCFLGFWSAFVEAGVNPHVIFLTLGELGIPQESEITPEEMAKIRLEEAGKALKNFNAHITMLSFPDLQLPFIPIEELVRAVLPIIRQTQTDAIFSFHPTETTPEFDHPDHNITGLVAKYVGAAADVENLMPEFKALEKRPELYLWTTNTSQSNTKIKLRKKIRKQRNRYLIENYPSQFSAQSEVLWKKKFNAITRKKNYSKKKKHLEQYIRVR